MTNNIYFLHTFILLCHSPPFLCYTTSPKSSTHLQSPVLDTVFSHLGWDWTGDDCFAHPLILHHMLLYSQQVHIQITHSITPLFPRPSWRVSPTNSHLPQCTQHTHLWPFHASKPPRTSLPQLYNRKVFNYTHHTLLLDLPFCHLTSAMYQHPVITPAWNINQSVCQCSCFFSKQYLEQISVSWA